MANTKILIAVLVLFATCCASAQAKLFKWVDDNGVTHYGEVIPPEYANKEAEQLEKGKVSKKESATKAKAGTEDQAAIDQKRRDEALLGTYSNEGEIDLARNRNLQQIDARTNSIKVRLDTAQADLNEHRKEQEDLTKAGKPIPVSLQEDLNQDGAKVAKLQDELTQSQNEAATLKARYEADKQRYRELTGGPKK